MTFPVLASPVLVRTDPTTTDPRLGCETAVSAITLCGRLKGKPTAATAEVPGRPAGRRRHGRELAFRGIVAMVQDMEASSAATHPAPEEQCHMPSQVPSGAALLAVELSEEARGIRGLDVLRRSVDRAPPTQSRSRIPR